jgi:hypothetical protein
MLTTSAGIMDHEEARPKNVSGEVLLLLLRMGLLLVASVFCLGSWRHELMKTQHDCFLSLSL